MASEASSVCPSCAAGAPGGARFCPACGARLSEPVALTEERKTVTTLFCDLVGFTAMGERSDPEDVDACLRSFGTLAREVIERYGGSVEKFIGDAVVGVFGVPVVHEDDPERAVRAALRLVESLDELSRPDGAPFQARAGVMTGELLVAHDVDPALGDGFVAGDAINTSARLEASAAPGTVVVGELTHRLTERVITYQRLAPVSVKGKARPLARWQALQPVARLGREATGGRLSPLVGRDSERDFLVSLLRRVVDTRTPQVALIIGHPGIGKTRLVRELFTVVDAGKEFITWRHGRCVPYGEDRTFWALREVVQAHAGILETHDPETAADLLERVVERGAGPPPHLRASPAPRRPRRARGRARGELRRLAAVLPPGRRAAAPRRRARGPPLGGRGAARVRRLRGGPRHRPAACSWSARRVPTCSSSTRRSRLPAAG